MIAAYDPGYELPLPPEHPFPMEKFRQAAEILRAECPGLEIVAPAPVDRATLELVHAPAYLDKLRDGGLAPAAIHRMGLPWSPQLLPRATLELAGTLTALAAARRDGVACNLAGGTHHAHPDRGLGYCVLNDVAVAIRVLQRREPAARVMILDTDAHQGDANHAIFAGDARVFTYSIHGGRNYPSAKVPGSLDVGLPRWVTGAAYLERLAATLPGAVRGFAPDWVFWISGVDPHAQDRFGQMGLSTGQLGARDDVVLAAIAESGARLVAVYGGGYHREPGMTGRLHANTVQAVARRFT